MERQQSSIVVHRQDPTLSGRLIFVKADIAANGNPRRVEAAHMIIIHGIAIWTSGAPSSAIFSKRHLCCGGSFVCCRRNVE